MSEPPAVLHYGGGEIELPVVVGSEDEHAIDIAKLRSTTGPDRLPGGDEGGLAHDP